ncbi:MAG: inositol monophosphatase family protein, partial [Candidatus Delongbacteria bacterium]
NKEDILRTSKEAAYKAGTVIKGSKALSVKAKSYSDYVTEVDIKCQNIIKNIIFQKFPDHVFLAEEDGKSFYPGQNMWIIDPLDGTTNFIQKLKHSSVSVAYYNGGKIMTGVIYDPYRDEMFSAIRGQGAFLNGKKISVSAKKEMSSCIFATGMPFKSLEKAGSYFECLKELLRNCAGIRRMGSAALDLAYTACGRFDGFFEGWLSSWDIAAGALIVEEAGGRIKDFAGDQDYLANGSVIAGGTGIFDEFYEIINTNLKDEI